MTRWPVAFLIVAAALAGASVPIQAQQDSVSVRYSWTGGGMSQRMRLGSGRLAIVEVVDLNPLCYDYTVTTKQEAGTDAALDAQLYITGGMGADKSRSPASDSVLLGFATPPEKSLRTARNVIVDARQTLAAALSRGLPIARSILTFGDRVCSGAGRARVSLSAVGEMWSAGPAGRLGIVEQWESALRSSNEALQTASMALGDADPGSRSFMTDARSLRKGIALLTDSISTTADSLSLAQTEHARIASLLQGTGTRTDRLLLNDDTEKLSVTVRATGKRGMTGVEKDTIQESFSVPVRRQIRTFVSLGFIASGVKLADYERRNVLMQDTVRIAKGDTTYSSYIDVAGGGQFVFSPVVSANVTLGEVDLGGALRPAIALSTGVTSRSVEKITAPEYLVGGSATLSDRVVLSLFYHWARTERLLIGDPSEFGSVRCRSQSKTRLASTGLLAWRSA